MSRVARATGVVACMESGTTSVSQHLALEPDAPSGGYKQGGLGVEFTYEGVCAFTA